MKSFTNIEELIGNTPLVELVKLPSISGVPEEFRVFAKIEFLNPCGSIKDRAALQMINDAEKSGKLDSDTVIIEPTSGNTGIALAAISSVRGYKTIIVMPESMSAERIDTMKAYGAEVVLTPAEDGMAGSIKKADELRDDLTSNGKKVFIPDQFSNPANAQAHYLTTGPEIYDELNGQIDAFVAGIGTGGTITGTAKFLKEKNQSIKIFGMEPSSSPILKGVREGQTAQEAQKKAAPHKIQGIGANFIPEILDMSLLDDIIEISDEQAYDFTKKLSANEAIFAGISSGANVAAAIEVAKLLKKQGYKEANIVTVLPDGGAKYMSTGVFDE